MYKYELEKHIRIDNVANDSKDIMKYHLNMHEVHELLAELFNISDGEQYFRCRNNILFVENLYSEYYKLTVQADIEINKERVQEKGFKIVKEEEIKSVEDYVHFRLRVSPYRRRENDPSKKRFYIHEKEERVKWLTNKLSHNGECSEIELEEKEVYVTKLSKKNNVGTVLYGIDYEGSCKVEDKDRFLAIMNKGIGSGKNYGFGLLEVVE